MDNCKNKGITTKYVGDVPVYAESMPDYFLGVQEITDGQTGDVTRAFVQTPASKVVPNGSFDNVIVLDTNNTELEVPTGQVRAGRINNTGSAYVMTYDDAGHAPQFLMLGDYYGQMMVQNTGFVNIPGGHEYIVGQEYYASADGTGLPTTDNTSGRKLFIPVSSTQLAVSMS